MFRKITLSTRALVTLANSAFERSKEQGISEVAVDEFFEEFSKMGKCPSAVLVDMDSGEESRFDGDYFSHPHAIGMFLAHENATHIFLQTPTKVFAYIIKDGNNIVYQAVL